MKAMPKERRGEMKNVLGLLCFFLLSLWLLCLNLPAEQAKPAEQPQEPELQDSDCVKCHIGIVKDLDANGASHKDLGCSECHQEHPPTGKNAIPKCSSCHDPGENDHFAVKNCTTCHNPHHPLNVDFTNIDAAKPVCATCHADKISEMKTHPSAHSEQDCNSCHMKHGLGKGESSNCLDCHDPHADNMKVADCTKCHKPHSPKEVTYGDVPNQLCAACHDQEASDLAATKTKHHEQACSDCHPEKHKNIMQCTECHDTPHGEFIHKKFPKCLDCHRDPHNLAK